MVIRERLRAGSLAAAWAALAVGAWAPAARAAAPMATIKVGFCSSSLTSGAAPFAIGTKFGWFAQ